MVCRDTLSNHTPRKTNYIRGNHLPIRNIQKKQCTGHDFGTIVSKIDLFGKKEVIPRNQTIAPYYYEKYENLSFHEKIIMVI